VVLILLITLFAVNKSVKSVIKPLELLEQDIKIITDGNLDYRATVYRNDEIGDITSGMNAMVDRLNFTLKELMSSQQQADAMSRLATLDSLTGVKNKTAFDRASENLEEGLRRGEKEFGFVLVDLNNLKLINDNYGHDKGDVAIKKLCRIICVIFNHSPVYRVGGDEFIVILLNEDYRNIDTLMAAYQEKIREVTEDSSAEPWERVSAAIGYALYDEKLDSGTDSLFSRADKEMYINKKHMKDN
jgi:diguanylate cyclase (GGDEF)-like protein